MAHWQSWSIFDERFVGTLIMISRKTIDEILAAANVEDVINDYVNLKRRGANLIGLCPFHNEKTPSFTVSPSKNLYKCFGCGRGGGAVSFIMEHEQFSYPEALRHLAKKYNIHIEEEAKSEEAIEEQQKKDSLLLINEMASKYFSYQLTDTEEGRSIGLSYYKHRGLNLKTIETFGLGYSSKNSKGLTEYAERKGYNRELLQELGLISQSGYDFFRERVIFPFHNLSGKVIGFGGRILKDNVKAPKYLNSPESNIYNKRKTLYGLYQARSEIRKADQCLLVEGYTDVLSLHQSEIKNVVASSGTSLTEEQVRLIKRFTSNVTVLYDGDFAGQKAALRGLDIFLQQGMNVKVAMLPEGHDPDSYVTEIGSTEFSSFVHREGHDFILMLARNIQEEYARDPIQKSVQVKDLTKSIAMITDQIKRSIYVKECARLLDMEEGHLFREINRNIKSEISKRRNRGERQPVVQEKYVDHDPHKDHSQGIRVNIDQKDYQEYDIIRILISGGNQKYESKEVGDTDATVGEYMMDRLGSDINMIKEPVHKAIVETYQGAVKQNAHPDHQFWSNHPDRDIASLAVEILSEKYIYANWSEKGLELQTQKPIEENYSKDCDQAILRFRFKIIGQRIKELEQMFAQQADQGKDVLLLSTLQKLIRHRQDIAEELGTTVL